MRPLSGLAESAWVGVRGLLRSLVGADRLNRVLDASGLRRWKRRAWRFEAVLPDGNLLIHRDQDRCVIEEVYAQDAYASADAIREGETVVDVGGHIGVFALMAARKVGPSGRVVVCEPSPESLALLRDNVARNGLARVAVHGVALTDKEGEADLYAAEPGVDNPVADTLFATPGRRPVRIPTTTLDALAMRAGLTRIDHLKIDVEGAEILVLKGAPKSLAMTKRIVMEVHPDRMEPAQVTALLEKGGFSWRKLNEKPGSLLIEALRAGPALP